MRCMGVDLGFRVGFGLLGGRRVLSGSFALKGSSTKMGEAFHSLVEVMGGLIAKHRPEAIGTAMPFISRVVTPVQLIPICGFFCRLQEICDDAAIPFHVIHEPHARKAFMGGVPRKSKDIKLLAQAECRARWWPVTDGHAADALAIASFMMEMMEPKRAHEQTPLFRAARGKKRAA